MPTARPPEQISRLLCHDRTGCILLLIFAALTIAAPPIAEPWLAVLGFNDRLFVHVVLETGLAILAILIFSVGWQTFKTDRNWPMTLLAVLFLATGAFNIAHLAAYLVAFLNATPGSEIDTPQKIAIFALATRAFTALALLLAASISSLRTISTSARILLLTFVVTLFATITIAGLFHSATVSVLLLNRNTIALRPTLTAALIGAFALAALLFAHRFRQHRESWQHHLLLASAMMMMAEISYAIPHWGRHTQPLIGHVLALLAYIYVYRAVFAYSIQWPIAQMNDWKQRLKTSQRELAITKMAVDHSGYYIFEFDRDETIRYASENACRRLGYRPEELIGASIWKISGEARQQTLGHDWSPLLARNATMHYKGSARTKNGDTFPVAATTNCVMADGELYIYAILEDITERKQFEEKTAERERYLRRLIDSIPTIVSIATPDGICIDTNLASEQNTSRENETLRGKSLLASFTAALSDASAAQALADAFAQARAGRATSLDLSIQILGSKRYLDFCIAPVRDDAGNLINLVTTATDITERVLAQNELKLASTVFDHSAEAILITDGDIHTLSVNKAFTTITGFVQQEMIGAVPPLFESGKHLQAMHAALHTSGHWSGEVEWIYKDGQLGYEWVTVTKVLGAAQTVSNYIVIFSDISEKKRAEEHIQYLAYYDPVTNLPNRVLLEERTKQTIAAAKRDGRKVAVMFLDLDHFKTINDTLGHHRGDKLLADVSKRLSRNVREADTVARQSGDEFVIVLSDLEEAEEAATVALKLLTELQLPYLIDSTELRVTVSIGVSIYPDDGEDFSRLIMNADAAMYHAKESGRNNVQFFIGEMNRRAAELLDMETRLRRAIEREEFLLHFQPQVDLQSGAIIGFEALVRWQDPERGLIPPAHFIPVAEERGLIAAIGDWVLREACRQNRAWQAAGLARLPIAVNISARQFRSGDFIDKVRSALAEAGLEAQYLELELTETAVMQDAENLISTLGQLQQLGLRLAIDDFGTGYSSLSYLKRFPIDKIKIDRSFIRDIPDDKDDHSIVQAIIGLSRQLNLKVVAEGVETPAQLDALRASRCDHYQGYYFSKPVAAADIEQLLRGQHPAPE